VKNGCGGGGGRVASSGWGGVRRGRRAAATQAMRCCQNPRHRGLNACDFKEIFQVSDTKLRFFKILKIKITHSTICTPTKL